MGGEKMRQLLRVLAWPFALVYMNLYIWVVSWSRYVFTPRLTVNIESDAIFEVVVPLETTVLTHWQAAFTDGFRCTLPTGVRLRAYGGAASGARSCVFVPEDVHQFTARFVPPEVSVAQKFAGVSLPLSPRQIQEHLAPIGRGTNRPPNIRLARAH